MHILNIWDLLNLSASEFLILDLAGSETCKTSFHQERNYHIEVKQHCLLITIAGLGLWHLSWSCAIIGNVRLIVKWENSRFRIDEDCLSSTESVQQNDVYIWEATLVFNAWIHFEEFFFFMESGAFSLAICHCRNWYAVNPIFDINIFGTTARNPEETRSKSVWWCASVTWLIWLICLIWLKYKNIS